MITYKHDDNLQDDDDPPQIWYAVHFRILDQDGGHTVVGSRTCNYLTPALRGLS
jgi:hypothetical protein